VEQARCVSVIASVFQLGGAVQTEMSVMEARGRYEAQVENESAAASLRFSYR
jgi:hypothetical protein